MVLQIIELEADLVHLEVVLEGVLLVLHLFPDLVHVLVEASAHVLEVTGGVAESEHLGEGWADAADLCDVLVGDALAAVLVDELEDASDLL